MLGSPGGRPAFRFDSKGKTLELLAPLVTKATLCDQSIVTFDDWQDRRSEIVTDLVSQFSPAPLAIRSSSSHEDGEYFSAAGLYLSRTSVKTKPEAIEQAIADVFASYGTASRDDHVLIQPMVEDVVISGVVLTRELNTGSPYYVVNYDDRSGRTDTVTGGSESKTILVHRKHTEALRSSRFRKLIESIVELEKITGCRELDVEFCITASQKVYVLQVRRLTMSKRWKSVADEQIDHALNHIRVSLSERFTPVEGLAGNSTVLSEMADWNPAEMIGNTPRPLALSLYKNLITDGVWAEARTRMGYRQVDHPLMLDLCGRPYIDVRLSLNSFLPADVDGDLASRIVDHQISRLRARPELHDKIEFEIAVTCRDFAYNESRQSLRDAGIDEPGMQAIGAGLARITHNALKAVHGGIDQLVGESNELLTGDPEESARAFPDRIKVILQRCRTLGTLPFSQLARHGFIAVLFLKSLVQRGVFSQEDYDSFMQGIQTITTELVRTMHDVTSGKASRDTFLSRFGHLRPATYDILSRRYDERPDLYLSASGRVLHAESHPFEPTAGHLAGISALLREFGYDISAPELLAYMANSIKAREHAKFAFSRSISNALVAITSWGDSKGLSRDDLSFIPIERLLDTTDRQNLRSIVDREREFSQDHASYPLAAHYFRYIRNRCHRVAARAADLHHQQAYYGRHSSPDVGR